MPLQKFSLTKAGAPTDGVNEMLTFSMLTDTVMSLEINNATGGTFALTHEEETTAELAYDASAATVENALIALDGITLNDVECSGGPLNTAPIAINFKGGYSAYFRSGVDVPLFTLVDAVEPAGTALLTIGYTQASPTGGNFTLTCDGDLIGPLAYDISPSNLQTALETITAIGEGNVLCDGAAELFAEEQTVRFVNDLAGVDVPDITADTSGLEVPAGCGTVALTITEDVKGVLGSYRGAPVGSTLFDTQNSKIYHNTGTAATPVWTAYPIAEV